MSRIYFEDLPSTNTPRNATNLNKLNNVVISSTEPNTGEEVWMQKGKNLITLKNIFIENEATATNIANGIRVTALKSGFFKYVVILLDNSLLGQTVTLNSTITNSSSNVGKVSLYFVNNDLSNAVEIETLSQTGNITISIPSTFPSGTNKITLLLYATGGSGIQIGEYADFTNLQLEVGSTATTYETYIDKKIYTKNNNDFYDKFYDESEINKEIYSTAEQVIGTWLGKPLYRRVFISTAELKAGKTTTVAAFQNIDVVSDIKFSLLSSDKSIYYQNYFINGTTGITIRVNKQNNNLEIINGSEDWSSPTIYITLEYTKTTD